MSNKRYLEPESEDTEMDITEDEVYRNQRQRSMYQPNAESFFKFNTPLEASLERECVNETFDITYSIRLLKKEMFNLLRKDGRAEELDSNPHLIFSYGKISSIYKIIEQYTPKNFKINPLYTINGIIMDTKIEIGDKKIDEYIRITGKCVKSNEYKFIYTNDIRKNITFYAVNKSVTIHGNNRLLAIIIETNLDVNQKFDGQCSYIYLEIDDFGKNIISKESIDYKNGVQISNAKLSYYEPKNYNSRENILSIDGKYYQI